MYNNNRYHPLLLTIAETLPTTESRSTCTTGTSEITETEATTETEAVTEAEVTGTEVTMAAVATAESRETLPIIIGASLSVAVVVAFVVGMLLGAVLKHCADRMRSKAKNKVMTIHVQQH